MVKKWLKRLEDGATKIAGSLLRLYLLIGLKEDPECWRVKRIQLRAQATRLLPPHIPHVGKVPLAAMEAISPIPRGNQGVHGSARPASRLFWKEAKSLASNILRGDPEAKREKKMEVSAWQQTPGV